jgi:hypothetical protein
VAELSLDKQILKDIHRFRYIGLGSPVGLREDTVSGKIRG